MVHVRFKPKGRHCCAQLQDSRRPARRSREASLHSAPRQRGRAVSMACACFLPDCPQCHPGPDDAWRFYGKYVTRVHRRPRYRFFTPTGAAAEGIPVAVEKLLNHRTTKIVKSDGSASVSQYDEDWKDSTAGSPLPYLWVGESIFEVAEEHIGAERHRCTQLQDSGPGVQLAGAERHRCAQPQDRQAVRESECLGPLGGRPACCCFLPDCKICNSSSSNSSRNMTATQSTSARVLGSGNLMPARGLCVIAGVHDELQKMLQQDGGWLAKGKGWDGIPSLRQDPNSHHASRLEKVVARLCRCSVQLVQKARSHSKKKKLVEPKMRGRKRRPSERETSSDGEELDGASALWEGGVDEASLQPTPARHCLGKVRGKFLPMAANNPEQHAIGLTLGRLMVWSFVNGIPRSAMTG